MEKVDAWFIYAQVLWKQTIAYVNATQKNFPWWSLFLSYTHWDFLDYQDNSFNDFNKKPSKLK